MYWDLYPDLKMPPSSCVIVYSPQRAGLPYYSKGHTGCGFRRRTGGGHLAGWVLAIFLLLVSPHSHPRLFYGVYFIEIEIAPYFVIQTCLKLEILLPQSSER